ncbi:MAG: methylated-DNA--[protein]-cysteine S-methyltransferase, partial [Thioalkalispiraceae bacterium]
FHGTSFQQKVWKTMLNIPPGKVMSYGEIAKKLNSSPRAVGNACRANPLPLLVPCHRVVSQAGLGGYGGETSGKRLAIKRWLLSHEGAAVKGL